jgi:hypothetical protein
LFEFLFVPLLAAEPPFVALLCRCAQRHLCVFVACVVGLINEMGVQESGEDYAQCYPELVHTITFTMMMQVSTIATAPLMSAHHFKSDGSWGHSMGP